MANGGGEGCRSYQFMRFCDEPTMCVLVLEVEFLLQMLDAAALAPGMNVVGRFSSTTSGEVMVANAVPQSPQKLLASVGTCPQVAQLRISNSVNMGQTTSPNGTLATIIFFPYFPLGCSTSNRTWKMLFYLPLLGWAGSFSQLPPCSTETSCSENHEQAE